MLKQVKLSPFIKDFLLTGATSVTTGLALIIGTSLLAQGLGPDGFGVYSLSRRILATIAPFSTLAMGVAVARHIAVAEDACWRFRLLLSGLLLGVLPSMAVGLFGAAFAAPLSSIIFHQEGYLSVFQATLFMLVGSSFYTVLYAFYRGSGKMGRANLWQLAVIALGPLAVATAYARTGRVEWILFLMGSLYFTAAWPLGLYLLKVDLACWRALNIAGPLKNLSRYALPRIPGDLALAGILSTSTFLAPYFGLLKDAGFLAVGQSLLMLTDTGLAAFGLIVLPKAAQLYSEGRVAFLRQRIADIISLAFHLGLYAALHLLLWSDELVYGWLGADYRDAIPVMRILSVALVPYFIYVLLRSVIDGVDNRAINTFNLYIALIVTVAFSLALGVMGLGPRGLAVGTTAGFFTLGLQTVRYLWRAGWVTPEVLSLIRLKECLWLNAGALAISLSLKSMIGRLIAPAAELGVALVLVIEVVLFSLYFAILRQYKMRWIIQLEQRVTRAGAP